MNYSYRAKSTNGAVSTGVIEAASPTEARRLLREKSLFALSIEGAGRVSGTATISSGRSVQSSGTARIKVKKTDLLMLTTQLTIMCRSGIDLAEAFKNVAEDCRAPGLRRVVLGVYDEVAAGASVSAALRRYEDVFGEAYVASIAAGEASGRVPEVLDQLATLLDNEIKLRNTLQSVLAYPCVLMLVAVLVLFALVFFVLPQFGHVFETLDTPAPPMTQFLLDAATGIRTYWMWVLGGGVAAVIGGVVYSRTPAWHRLRDGILLNSPLFKDAMRPLLTGRSFRLIGTMLESGLPLVEAIQLARKTTSNTWFLTVFDRMEAEILKGNGIAPSLRASSVIPTGAVQLISTAERTGRLGPVMLLVGDFYEREGERLIRSRAKLLEPMIIVAMGVVVAFVVASVMLPLLDVSTSAPH